MPKYGLALDNLRRPSSSRRTARCCVQHGREPRPVLGNARRRRQLRSGGVLEYDLHPVGPIIIGGLVAHPLASGRRAEVLPRTVRVAARRDDARRWPADRSGRLRPQADGHRGVSLRDARAGGGRRHASQGLRSARHGRHGADSLQHAQRASRRVMPRGALNYWKAHFLSDLSDPCITRSSAASSSVPRRSRVFIEHFHGAATRVRDRHRLHAADCRLQPAPPEPVEQSGAIRRRDGGAATPTRLKPFMGATPVRELPRSRRGQRRGRGRVRAQLRAAARAEGEIRSGQPVSPEREHPVNRGAEPSAPIPMRTRWLGAGLMIAGILFQAPWLGLPAAIVSIALLVSYGLWIATSWQVTPRLRVAFLAGILVFLAHGVEELLAGLPRALPALFGRDAWSDRRFLVFKGAWALVFCAAAVSLRPGRPLPVFIVLFFAVAGGVGNGVVHLLLVLRRGGYFPGAWTAPLRLAVGVWLLRLLYASEPRGSGRASP